MAPLQKPSMAGLLVFFGALALFAVTDWAAEKYRVWRRPKRWLDIDLDE